MDDNSYKPPSELRFTLRTLMIVLAIAPPVLWGAWLLIAAKPKVTAEGLISLGALSFAIALLVGPVRRGFRRLNNL